MQLQPVVLSGGSGTRLWPLSREAYPKQFLPLVGKHSMLQATLLRLEGVAEEHPEQEIQLSPPLVVCNEGHRFLVADQLLQLGREPASILLEPEGRNTAPALAMAALAAVKEGKDPVLIAMPADHLIADEAEFRQAVAQGHSLAAGGSVVTFGIVPTGAETGYGYILKGKPLAEGGDGSLLESFVEKPDRATAERYLESGKYLWNSGIFMLRARVWLKLVERYQPDMAAACRDAYNGGSLDGDFYRFDAERFCESPSDSIDYAVMEKLSGGNSASGPRAVVLPLAAGWSDVGTWPALLDVKAPDETGNVHEGDTFVHRATGNLLLAQHRMLAAVGVKDLIIVETPDAVLVADKEHAQEVKLIAERLKREERSEFRYHRRVHRPWGAFEPIDNGSRYQVKRITVKPGASLSLQMHHHRAEHWIVVSGTARVTRGDERFLLGENESTYIPMGATHRLENPGTIPLEIIEVQSGSYLGEDDIIRFEDDYNRSSED